jgi:hypothetical protein
MPDRNPTTLQQNVFFVVVIILEHWKCDWISFAQTSA